MLTIQTLVVTPHLLKKGPGLLLFPLANQEHVTVIGREMHAALGGVRRGAAARVAMERLEAPLGAAAWPTLAPSGYEYKKSARRACRVRPPLHPLFRPPPPDRPTGVRPSTGSKRASACRRLRGG